MRPADNPFSSFRMDSFKFRFNDGMDMDSLIRRLGQIGNRAAIVGPQGSGKTTLMIGIGEYFAGRGMKVAKIFLNQSNRHRKNHFLKILDESYDAVLLDGSEQIDGLTWFRVKRLSAKSTVFIITAHATRRLPVLIECRTSSALLRELVDEALLKSSVPLAVGEGFAERQAGVLFKKHNGDIRLALRELYDLFGVP